MPKITEGESAERSAPIDEMGMEGQDYLVVGAEYVEKAHNDLDLVRVTLVDAEGELWELPLWLGKSRGPNTKVGSFVVALGDETDDWVGNYIRMARWREREKLVQNITPDKVAKETPSETKPTRRR